ncbi:DUF1493 family protein [Zhouia amylolytica]|nr:DUF1493 family protein [Zhouia amylolytica]
MYDFILDERGLYRFEIQEQHSLQSDLNIYGMDAVEFILSFGNKFGVDVSNFDAEKYFKPDGYNSFEKDYQKLTISNLLESIEKGILL